MTLLLKNKFIIESCTNAVDNNSSVTQSLKQTERSFVKKREVFEQCFEVLDRWILSKLKQQRGAEVPNFATLTWEVYETLSGERKTRPVFLPKADFVKAHKILYQAPVVEPTVAPSEEANFTKLAIKFSNNLTKDVVFSGVRDIVRKIGEVCGAGRDVCIEFSFGTLKARERRLGFEFNPQALLDGMKEQSADANRSLNRERPQTMASSRSRMTTSRGRPATSSKGSRTLSIREEMPSSRRSHKKPEFNKQYSDSSQNKALQEEDQFISSEEPETTQGQRPATVNHPYRKPEILFHGGIRPLRKLPSDNHDAGKTSLVLGSHAIKGQFAPTDLTDPSLVPGLVEAEDPMEGYKRATSAKSQDRPVEAGFMKENEFNTPIMEAAVQRYIQSMKKVAKEEEDMMHRMNKNREKDEESMQNRIDRMKQRRLELQSDIVKQMDDFNLRKKIEHDERRSAATNANFPLPLNAKTRLSLGGGVYSVPFEPPMEMSTGNGGIDFGPRRGKGKQIDKETLQNELKLEIQNRLKQKQDARDQRINEEKQYVDQVLNMHERAMTAQRIKNFKLKNETVNSLNRDIHMKNLHKLTRLGETHLNNYMQLYARSESVPPGISEKNMFAMSRKLGSAGSAGNNISGSVGFDARNNTR